MCDNVSGGPYASTMYFYGGDLIMRYHKSFLKVLTGQSAIKIHTHTKFYMY